MIKLLIADDEIIIRESVRDLIPWAALGIEICACCKNGLEALDAILDTAPDIVMTDIRMPGISGLELIEKIQKFDPNIRFIILTGYPEFDYARRALTLGVSEYLLKPLDEQEIIKAVENVRQTLPEYRPSPMAVLIGSLLESRAQNDAGQARILLQGYLAHLKNADELRSAGIELSVRLTTRLAAFSADSLAAFHQRLLQAEPEQLRLLITDEIAAVLFAKQTQKPSLADQVCRYVLEHLSDEELSLKFIAENVLYMNVNYLSRAFTKQTGENFSAFLNRTRIEKAKQMLRLSASNVHQIAEQVGFGNNPQYFSQVFKKYTGMTPSQFAEGQS